MGGVGGVGMGRGLVIPCLMRVVRGFGGFLGFVTSGLSYSPYVFPTVASGDFSSVIFREHS